VSIMKITFSFNTTEDLSSLTQGEELLEILLSYGLVIEKADQDEPIRKEFDVSMLPERWKGVGLAGKHSSCYFLFKGQEKIKFSGMITWNINLPPNTNVFNGVHLWLNTSRSLEVTKLISLGDELFKWSNSVYGYISEHSKDIARTVPAGLYYGLPGLMWVNYFGPAYLKEPDFHIPANHVFVGQGVRVCLSEKPNEDILGDSDFLQNYKEQFGVEWFWKGDFSESCRTPCFDHSALIRA
jgi:hypothetical protein